MRHTIITIKILGMALMLTGLSGWAADDKKPGANDPTGNWTWSFTTGNGDTINSFLKLKRDGEKLTGTLTGRGGTETAIEKGTIKGDEVSFEVTRERDGNKFVSKYNGKISGDWIKGKTEFNVGGENRSRDWEAKRAAANAKPQASTPAKKGITGSWKYALNTTTGQKLEPVIALKQDGEKVTGTIVIGENESPISDGTFKDDEVSFKTVRERDGRTITSTYKGKMEGDTIKGKITSNWGGNDRTYDFEAKRE